jgi:hypothetical protein
MVWLMSLHVAPPLGAAVVVVVVVVAIVDVVVAFAPVVAADDDGNVVVELVVVDVADVAAAVVVVLAVALLTVDRSQLVALPLHGMHLGPCRRAVSAGNVPAGHATHVSAPVDPSHCSI